MCSMFCNTLAVLQKFSMCAGDQGAELLPVLLKPGGLGSLSKEDRKRLRSQVCPHFPLPLIHHSSRLIEPLKFAESGRMYAAQSDAWASHEKTR